MYLFTFLLPTKQKVSVASAYLLVFTMTNL